MYKKNILKYALRSSIVLIFLSVIGSQERAQSQFLLAPDRIRQDTTIPQQQAPQPTFDRFPVGSVEDETDYVPFLFCDRDPGVQFNRTKKLSKLGSLPIYGVKVYKESDLEEFFAPETDLRIVAGQIIDLYEKDGYQFVEARVNTKTNRIEIFEGTVQSIKISVNGQDIENSDAKQRKLIKNYKQKLKKRYETRPFHSNDRTFRLMTTQLPGVFPIPGQISCKIDKNGDLIMNIPLAYISSVSVGSFTNRNTDETGPLTTFAQLLINSPLGKGEQVSLSGGLTPIDSLEFGTAGLSVNFPIGNDGVRIQFGGAFTALDFGGDLIGIEAEATRADIKASVVHSINVG